MLTLLHNSIPLQEHCTTLCRLAELVRDCRTASCKWSKGIYYGSMFHSQTSIKYQRWLGSLNLLFHLKTVFCEVYGGRQEPCLLWPYIPTHLHTPTIQGWLYEWGRKYSSSLCLSALCPRQDVHHQQTLAAGLWSSGSQQGRGLTIWPSCEIQQERYTPDSCPLCWEPLVVSVCIRPSLIPRPPGNEARAEPHFNNRHWPSHVPKLPPHMRRGEPGNEATSNPVSLPYLPHFWFLNNYICKLLLVDHMYQKVTLEI